MPSAELAWHARCLSRRWQQYDGTTQSHCVMLAAGLRSRCAVHTSRSPRPGCRRAGARACSMQTVRTALHTATEAVAQQVPGTYEQRSPARTGSTCAVRWSWPGRGWARLRPTLLSAACWSKTVCMGAEQRAVLLVSLLTLACHQGRWWVRASTPKQASLTQRCLPFEAQVLAGSLVQCARHPLLILTTK